MKSKPDYPRCETCRWWDGRLRPPDRQREQWRCDCPNVGRYSNAFGHGSPAYTCGSFGCVYHEEWTAESVEIFDGPSQ